MLVMLIAFCEMMPLCAQSSFPPKSFPSSIKVLTDSGVAQYWDVKRIMCLGRANGGYKFRIYGRANADHRGQSVNMYYILPGNVLKTAGAYQFPAVKEGQSFNFEIVSAFVGHAPAKFEGFMIMDEWLKAPETAVPEKKRRYSDEEVPVMPEELRKSVEQSSISAIDEVRGSIVAGYNSNRKLSVEDFDTDPKPKEKKEEEICTDVDAMPEFPGGMTALSRWLGGHLDYPERAKSSNVQGCVKIRFVVEKDGSIGYADIVRSVDRDLDKEALRVVKAMPRWTPGKKGGKPVRAYFTIPINFRLQ